MKTCKLQQVQTAFCKILKWNEAKTKSETYYGIIRQIKYAFDVMVLVDNPQEWNQAAEFEYEEPDWNNIEVFDWFFTGEVVNNRFLPVPIFDSLLDADNPLVEYKIMNLLDTRIEILAVERDMEDCDAYDRMRDLAL